MRFISHTSAGLATLRLETLQKTGTIWPESEKIVKKITVFVVLLVSLLGPLRAGAVPAEAQKIMVAGPSPYATEIAESVTAAGGNAVDVAVAVALSLAVTHPYYASFGGGGFAVVQVGKETAALDFRETAGEKASPTMFKAKDKDASIQGGLAVGVPGSPAGLFELQKKYGALNWSRLFAIPIRLAEKGFFVSGEWAHLTNENKDAFSAGGKQAFFKKDGSDLKPGDLLKQPKLASLLREMSNRGVVPFYQGTVARDILDAVGKTGGTLTLKDFETYRVRWLKPMELDFAGVHLLLMPPPSSGGVTIASALKLVKLMGVDEKAALSSDEEHGLIEALRASFQARPMLGDPDFSKNPIEAILNETRLKAIAKKFRWDKTSELEPLTTLTSPDEKRETTHISVMDNKGNAVAMTMTLNGSYGSRVVSEKFGVSLNNEMDDFTTRPGEGNMYGLVQGLANEVAPGKRPLSSMSPTIVQKNGVPVYAIGSPGGPRIISAVFQVLYRVLVSNFDIDQAIQAPRIHHQYAPDVVNVDPHRFSPDVLTALKKKGHKIEGSTVAKVYVVHRRDDGLLEGAFDSRGEGGDGGF